MIVEDALLYKTPLIDVKYLLSLLALTCLRLVHPTKALPVK